MEKQGGVLYRDLFSDITVQSSIVGVPAFGLPRRSFLTITMVTPAGPTFFWAPA